MQHADYGALVISLDFELYWGVTDLYVPGSRYDANVLGARKVIPRLLALFEEAGLSATWCTVGLVFAESRRDAEQYFPDKRPRYQNREFCAYTKGSSASADETFYYASELVRLIANQPKQEVGTHTFSHYYCLEPGQDVEDFEADLIAAKRIAEKHNISLRSIVFPRNQVNPSYLSALVRHGIAAYRGTELTWMNSAGSRSQQRDWKKRASRLADAYINLSGDNSYSWDDVLDETGLCNVRASRYLRPYSRSGRALERRRLQRVIAGMEAAARSKRVFHLWWHPEDMGQHLEESLENVRIVAKAFGQLRQAYGMRAMSMGDIADVVSPRIVPSNEATSAVRHRVAAPASF
ncbi:MAG: polysaccharide deacetylase family protein [Acidobacteriota bacterium]|nr:polysaccharide deacetylase family protein [Acidobacteriota bacterium]